MTVPRVSVLLPVRNSALTIAAAVRSIVGQVLQDWELLLGDDASADSTAAAAEVAAAGDLRIRVIRFGEHTGVAGVLNRLEEEARGEFIARMDGDDEALPGRLLAQLEFLIRNPAIGICGTAVEAFGAINGVLRLPTSPAAVAAWLPFQPPLIHPTVLWRRSLFREHGLCYQTEPPTAEDYDLWWRASSHLPMANLPEVHLRYRTDPSTKISAYLAQQEAGDREVKGKILSALGLAPTPELVDLLVALGKHRSVDPGSCALLRPVLLANRRCRIFNPARLEGAAAARLYRVLAGLAPAPASQAYRAALPRLSPSTLPWYVRLMLRSLLGSRFRAS